MRNKLIAYLLFVVSVFALGCQDGKVGSEVVSPELSAVGQSKSELKFKRIFGDKENPDSVRQLEVRVWDGDKDLANGVVYKINYDKTDRFLAEVPNASKLIPRSAISGDKLKSKSDDGIELSAFDGQYIEIPGGGSLTALASADAYYINHYNNGAGGMARTESIGVPGIITHHVYIEYYGWYVSLTEYLSDSVDTYVHLEAWVDPPNTYTPGVSIRSFATIIWEEYQLDAEAEAWDN